MEGNWKNKLEQWAPAPPDRVWERLSKQLEEVPQPLYAQKLQEFTETPPAATWEAIAARLEAPAAAPVVSMFSKNKIVRYGSVAASLLFCFFLFRQLSPYRGSVNNSRDKVLQQQTVLPLPREIGDLRVDKNQRLDEGVEVGPVASRASSIAYLPPIPALHIDKNPMPTLSAKRMATVRIYEVMPATAPDLNDGYVERYIVIPVAEDAAVRLPKKLYDLFRCGEVPLPAGCSELVARLRQQSGDPSFVAAADFPGLLELIQQVELHQ